MPYEKIHDLPEKAQKIFLEAYNSAWEQYKDPQKRKGGASREETAMKVAWAAVKNKYEKDPAAGDWKRKE